MRYIWQWQSFYCILFRNGVSDLYQVSWKLTVFLNAFKWQLVIIYIAYTFKNCHWDICMWREIVTISDLACLCVSWLIVQQKKGKFARIELVLLNTKCSFILFAALWLFGDSLFGWASQVHQATRRPCNQPAETGCSWKWHGWILVWQAHLGKRQQLNTGIQTPAAYSTVCKLQSMFILFVVCLISHYLIM